MLIGNTAICCYCFNHALVAGIEAACAQRWAELLASGALGTEDEPLKGEHWSESLYADWLADVREAYVKRDTPLQPPTTRAAAAAYDRDVSGALAFGILADAYQKSLRP